MGGNRCREPLAPKHRNQRSRIHGVADRDRDDDGEESRTLLTLRGAMPREGRARQPLCADIEGFSQHDAVREEAHDRKRLEQLCRYITRPVLSNERVQLNASGQVELKLKTPWRNGTTHLVMSPLKFLQRLAAMAI